MTLTREMGIADTMLKLVKFFSNKETINNIALNENVESIENFDFQRFVKYNKSQWNDDGSYEAVSTIYDNVNEKTCYVINTKEFLYLPNDFYDEEEFLLRLDHLIYS